MIGSLYTGLSGLIAYSRGLDVISNNIANLNTPGYKGIELLFSDVGYQYSAGSGSNNSSGSLIFGKGVSTGETSLSFSQGDIRESGNSTDIAIDGGGFFVLERDGQRFLTRSGQFEFDGDGDLVAKGIGAKVLGFDENGRLAPINIADLRINPPQATTEVTFINNLSSGSSLHRIVDVTVYDSKGDSKTLTVTFRNNNSVTEGSWLIDVVDNDTGDVLASDLEIRFQGNGSPVQGFESVGFDYEEGDGITHSLNFSFGTAGSFSGATGFTEGTTSTLSVSEQNGHTKGSMLGLSFKDDGELMLSYSNGEEVGGIHLALADVTDLQSLEPVGSGLFKASVRLDVTYARPDDGALGSVKGSSLELSNVELSRQFADMIIVQRGYQASSQILTTANEMIQQLLDASGKK